MWSGKLSTMDATSRIRSALAKELPPNFMTMEYCSKFSPGWKTTASAPAPAGTAERKRRVACKPCDSSKALSCER